MLVWSWTSSKVSIPGLFFRRNSRFRTSRLTDHEYYRTGRLCVSSSPSAHYSPISSTTGGLPRRSKRGMPTLIGFPLYYATYKGANGQQNAEALRLRLKVAMYKVKTNQTDLPLSQLQIRASRAHNAARTLLPSSRLFLASQHGKPVTPTSHPSQFSNDEVEDHTSIPSSSPPPPMSPDRSSPHAHSPRCSDFATPILPRSRGGYSRVRNSRGSPEPGPEVTSSVVKGRAADGLLSLMGGGLRHA